MKDNDGQTSIYKHAVIVHFDYGLPQLDALYELENKLEKVLTEDVGEYDGHEIAMDHTDGMLFMYGVNAEVLFKTVHPVLEATKFMKGAVARLRFGTLEDGAKEINIEIRRG